MVDYPIGSVEKDTVSTERAKDCLVFLSVAVDDDEDDEDDVALDESVSKCESGDACQCWCVGIV